MGVNESAPQVADAGPPRPAHAGRFDGDELAILRRAFAQGGEHGLGRPHFARAFGALLPTGAVDRLFAAMAAGERISWTAWVDGLAAACKPSGGASEPGAANAPRLGVLWDLFSSAEAQPSEAVRALDAKTAPLGPDEPGEGALDERGVRAALACCARHCAGEQALGGAEATEPLVRGALLAGPLSRAAWVRWASACAPLLGEAFELLLMRGVAQLAGAPQPAGRTLRLAEERWLPRLVGLGGEGGADDGGGAGAQQPSLILSPALTWGVSLSIPQPASGAPTDAWRLLYSSAEHGLSQNRLAKHVLGYAGPTLLAVTLADGFSWAGAPRLPARRPRHRAAASPHGPRRPSRAALPRSPAYLDSPWEPAEAGRFFGADRCCLFLLAPHFHAFRATRASSNFCAFVQHARAALAAPAGARGRAAADAELVGFGGAPSHYRCQLTEDLTRCVWRHSCSVFKVCARARAPRRCALARLTRARHAPPRLADGHRPARRGRARARRGGAARVHARGVGAGRRQRRLGAAERARGVGEGARRRRPREPRGIWRDVEGLAGQDDHGAGRAHLPLRPAAPAREARRGERRGAHRQPRLTCAGPLSSALTLSDGAHHA